MTGRLTAARVSLRPTPAAGRSCWWGTLRSTAGRDGGETPSLTGRVTARPGPRSCLGYAGRIWVWFYIYLHNSGRENVTNRVFFGNHNQKSALGHSNDN